MTRDPPLHRIVLTGGPCGGKSTAMSQIADRLQSFGYGVFLVPEAATLLLSGGCRNRGVEPKQSLRFQANLLRAAMALEDAFIDIARSTGKPAVVLCDRGAMDGQAYLPPEDWRAMLAEGGWNVVALRDGRYDAVIELVTAADGAEAFYTTANNAARCETVAEARELESRVQEAWVGNPHLRVIDNSTDFAGKVRRAVQAVCRVVGVPEPVEAERKYLVRSAPAMGAMPVACQEVEIEQHYLIAPDGSEARIRQRGQAGSHTYTHTTKQPTATAGVRVEIEHRINGREYAALLTQADPALQPVRKLRRCFVWESQYFELDTFLSPRSGMQVLELELDDEKAKPALPPFVQIEREVTGERQYSNRALAGAGE